MELYIFNRNMEFQGITEGYTSLRWTRRYFKAGEFELQCASTSESLILLQRENIIYKKGDTEAGFIEYRNLKQNSEGNEILIIKGKFLTGYLNRRIIWGAEILSGASEVAMRTLVNKNCIDPTDTNRIINNLILGNLNNYNDNVDYQVSYKNLSEELENLSNISNLGYKVTFDAINKKLIFDVYKGLDRSVNQDINPRCIFSKEFENILEQEYVDSLNNYKNLALVGGVGEGSARKLTTVGNSIGLDRFEVFADQKGLSNEVNSVAMSDADYTNLLIGKGNEALSETKEIKTFDSKVNLNSNLKYKVDFDLGDIVTYLSKKWGITLDSRIIEVEEVYEESGQQINIVFGNNIPTLIDKIKSMSKQQSGAGGVSSTTSVELTNIDGGSFV
jgi:hypothetical protein